MEMRSFISIKSATKLEYLALLLLFNIVLEDLNNVLNHEGEMTATTVGKEKIRILFEYGTIVHPKQKKNKRKPDNPTKTVRFNNISK